MKELVPTGKLRVAIAISPSPSALYAVKDASTGKFRGVTVDLDTALGKKLGVPVEFLAHLASGEIQNSAASGKWDVTFMPVDDERKQKLDFGAAHIVLQSTWMVGPGSPIRTLADVDRAGTRVVGVENTASARAAQRYLKNVTVGLVKSTDEGFELLRTG